MWHADSTINFDDWDQFFALCISHSVASEPIRCISLCRSFVLSWQIFGHDENAMNVSHLFSHKLWFCWFEVQVCRGSFTGFNQCVACLMGAELQAQMFVLHCQHEERKANRLSLGSPIRAPMARDSFEQWPLIVPELALKSLLLKTSENIRLQRLQEHFMTIRGFHEAGQQPLSSCTALSPISMKLWWFVCWGWFRKSSNSTWVFGTCSSSLDLILR